MKKVLIFVMALFTASSVLASEGMGKAGGEGKEGKRHEIMQLNLTDTQKAQMKTLREQHRAEKEAMREKHKAEIKAILTPEQSAKFEQRMPKRPGMEKSMNREGGMHGQEGKKNGEGMKAKRSREDGDQKPE